MYTFDEQLAIGKLAESRIDRLLLSLGYETQIVGMDLERRGIDRIVTTPNGAEITAEYKADFHSVRTGNVFLESTVDGKPGWVIRSQADAVLYWAHPGSSVVDSSVYVLNRKKILRWFFRNRDTLRKCIVPNDTFIAEGYLAPIPLVFKHCGIKKLIMKKEFLA